MNTQPMNMDGLKSEIENSLAKQEAGIDPKHYISQADGMLSRARNALIRAEAIYGARRETECIAFKDKLLRMDADHAKMCDDLNGIIYKLEQLRS